ncbi:hypothetical protein PENTCL1PPCAC_16389, partial [Pristionchus entomophagus]
ICYFSMIIVIVIMIGQLLIELKHGMSHASTATKRYQKRAVMSLVFQGVVPNCIYVIPVIIEGCVYSQTIWLGLEKA